VKILVVGGGTAGLIAATIIKKRFGFSVDVVRSSNIGIIGVGEGSTEHFREYLEFMQLDPYELIQKTDATYKVGIMFDGWGEKNYLHNVHDDFSTSSGQYYHVYASQIANNTDHLHPRNLMENVINGWFLNKKDFYPANQFHFDTEKLNSFLTSVAKVIGIEFYDDEIVEIIKDESENISMVVGKNKEYAYDFYVDATGFNRSLIGTFPNNSWVSFEEHLKVNSAITFQSEASEENINLWTTATAMDYGWMFSLPTWNHQGNGYIYNNKYINEEQAILEVESLLNKKIKVGKSFYFNPGYLEKTWINNCVAVGLSGSFVEPLEATSIGSTIQQSFLIIHKLANYNQKEIDLYNSSFSSIMENIRDFIFLHYITGKKNTEFWQEVSEIPYPKFIKKMLPIWENRLPLEEDFSEFSRYKMFGPKNFILVMNGLGLFNSNSILNEFKSVSQEIKNDAENSIQESMHLERVIDKISHKDFIGFIREYKKQVIK
jgi:tryptophan halogenase